MNGRDIKHKGTAIKLDYERHLVYDINAFIEMEDSYGSLEDAFSELQSKKIKAIRYLLYLGLIHEDENLTEKQAGKLIDLKNISDVAQKILDAITEAMPEVHEGKNG